MTVDRVILSPSNGLKISSPGVAVKSAPQQSLWFDSSRYSLPIFERIDISISSSTSMQTFLFSQAFSFVPTVQVFLSDGAPDSGAYSSSSFLLVSSLLTRKLAYAGMYNSIGYESTAHLSVFLYNDRIAFQNYQDGNDADTWSGYARVILYEFLLTETV